jgi:hypothetical protein
MDDWNQRHGRENSPGSKPLAREKSPRKKSKLPTFFIFSNTDKINFPPFFLILF